MITSTHESLYLKPDEAPWTFREPPKELVELVEKKIICPSAKILEIGCGEGHQAIYLAKNGFKVTAIDNSQHAIHNAKLNAQSEDAKVNFLQMDYHQINELKTIFDFIFDWRFLHEIIDEKEREKYFPMIQKRLALGGKYLSVAFSGDSEFMDKGILRTSPIGVTIWVEKQAQSEQILGTYFKILLSKHILVPQKPDFQILANFILCQKK